MKQCQVAGDCNKFAFDHNHDSYSCKSPLARLRADAFAATRLPRALGILTHKISIPFTQSGYTKRCAANMRAKAHHRNAL